MVKNKMAVTPDLTATALTTRNRLLTLFAEVSKSQLIALWHKTVKNCQDYMALDAQDENSVES